MPLRSMEMVRLLLEKGADPNKQDESGMTPLDVAVQRCAHQDVIEMLFGGGKKDMGDEKQDTTQGSLKSPKSKEYDWIFINHKFPFS